jgi:hypothetical protein
MYSDDPTNSFLDLYSSNELLLLPAYFCHPYVETETNYEVPDFT